MPNSYKKALPMKDLIALRKLIHQNPELSGCETQTAQRIVQFAKPFQPDNIITQLGGHGVAILFKGTEEGPTVLIRGDMDALPVQEQSEQEHRSSRQNIAHLCGHDGHVAIVAGLIPLLSVSRPQKGQVILLFQPAEESGEGAAAVLADPGFAPLRPDYAFALHNLPGFHRNEIVICEKEFASASQGIIAQLRGKTSHAAEPEKGLNPALAVAEIIPRWLSIPSTHQNLKDFTLLTLIHARIGQRAFGTSAGDAEVMATLRSFTNQDMQVLTREACRLVQEISFRHHLQHSIEFIEKFPATFNHAGCLAMIEQAAGEHRLKIQRQSEPFKWSEDFGFFTQHCQGAMFGLGAGVDHPSLHQPNYDFPDEIMETGIKVFHSLIGQILG